MGHVMGYIKTWVDKAGETFNSRLRMTKPISSEGIKLRRYMCCPIACQQQRIHSLGTLKPDKSMTPLN